MSNSITTTEATMSSREIAELTGKQHSNIMRDIRNMLESMGADQNSFLSFDNSGARGRRVDFYLLDRYHTEVLVTGYDVKRRAAVIKRWYDLETGAAVPAAESEPAFQVPTTMAEALRLAADQSERLEQQQQALEAARPAVEFVDQYVESSGNSTFREVAKILNAKEPEFRQFLQDQRIMYKVNGGWLPYASQKDTGRFVVKTGTTPNGQHTYTQTRFTPKGIKWVAGLWAQRGFEE